MFPRAGIWLALLHLDTVKPSVLPLQQQLHEEGRSLQADEEQECRRCVQHLHCSWSSWAWQSFVAAGTSCIFRTPAQDAALQSAWGNHWENDQTIQVPVNADGTGRDWILQTVLVWGWKSWCDHFVSYYSLFIIQRALLKACR